MNPVEIEILRSAVANAGRTGAAVFWCDPLRSWRRVTSVPAKPLDPDGTGHPEIVALLDGGHLDLENCDPREFWIGSYLFAEAE